MTTSIKKVTVVMTTMITKIRIKVTITHTHAHTHTKNNGNNTFPESYCQKDKLVE